MGRKDNQKIKEDIPTESEVATLESQLSFQEVRDLLLTQINILDKKINQFFLINIIFQVLIVFLSVALIIIGIIFAFQYGPGRLKMIFSLISILIGLLFLGYSIHLNIFEKMIPIVKRNSQIKVILIGFLKEMDLLSQNGNRIKSDEISKLVSLSRDIVQQTVDDLENPFE